MGTNVEGHSFEFDNEMVGETSYHALLDIGLLDVDLQHIKLTDATLRFSGASSDMIVVDLGENPNNYKVGDLIEFEMDYLGILRIINSRHIEKKIK